MQCTDVTKTQTPHPHPFCPPLTSHSSSLLQQPPLTLSLTPHPLCHTSSPSPSPPPPHLFPSRATAGECYSQGSAAAAGCASVVRAGTLAHYRHTILQHSILYNTTTHYRHTILQHTILYNTTTHYRHTILQHTILQHLTAHYSTAHYSRTMLQNTTGTLHVQYRHTGTL